MSRACRLFGVLTACAAVLAACGSPEPTTTKVIYNMSWLPQGSQSGVIAAIEQGFYREQGLEVDAVRGFGGIRTTNEVDQGMFQFGYGDPISVALNRSQGGKSRMIGVINEYWPAGLCFVVDRHAIKTPADLKGLRVGGGQNSPVQALLPVWLQSNEVDPASVTLLQLNPSVIVTSLIEGQIDAAECWAGNSRPLFEQAAKQAGLQLGWIEYRSFGLDMYGSGLVASDTLIAKDPDLVKKFVAATYRGYAFVLANPDQARDLMVKKFPTLDRDVTGAQIAELATLMRGPGTLGALSEERMASTMQVINRGYQLEGKVAVQDLYTQQFAPQASSGATP